MSVEVTVQTEQVEQSVQSGPPKTGSGASRFASLASGVVVHGGGGGGVGQTYLVVVMTFVTLPLPPLPDDPPLEPDP